MTVFIRRYILHDREIIKSPRSAYQLLQINQLNSLLRQRMKDVHIKDGNVSSKSDWWFYISLPLSLSLSLSLSQCIMFFMFLVVVF